MPIRIKINVTGTQNRIKLASIRPRPAAALSRFHQPMTRRFTDGLYQKAKGRNSVAPSIRWYPPVAWCLGFKIAGPKMAQLP
jgi:hypothetical protein